MILILTLWFRAIFDRPKNNEIRTPRIVQNAEGIIAVYGKLPFRQMDEWSLQNIPGISDRISKRLVESKNSIKDSKSLIDIKGIGPKLSEKIGNQLVFEDNPG